MKIVGGYSAKKGLFRTIIIINKKGKIKLIIGKVSEKR